MLVDTTPIAAYTCSIKDGKMRILCLVGNRIGCKHCPLMLVILDLSDVDSTQLYVEEGLSLDKIPKLSTSGPY